MGTRRALPIAVLLSVGALVAQGGAPRPTFVAGDLAALRCRVVDVDAVDEWANLVTVEVTNTGDVDGEPLVFRLEWTHRKDKRREVHDVPRARLPLVARYGNPTPRGGKMRYRVRTHLPFTKGKGEVQVTAASFHRGGSVPAPDLRIGRPTQVQRTSLAGTFPVTQVALTNPFDRDVDVLLEVALTQPTDCTELFGVRLPAAATLDWVIPSRPGRSPFLDADSAPGAPLKAVRFEVVDWCLVGDDDPAPGAGLLREAWSAFYRWPEPGVVVAGDFTYRHRHQRLNRPDEYDDATVAGRFTIDGALRPRVEITSGAGANPDLLLTLAFADVLREDFETVAQKNRLVRVADSRVALVGPGWSRAAGGGPALAVAGVERHPELFEDLEVRAGHIVSSGCGYGPRTAWEARDLRAGYVIARRSDGTTETTWSYRDRDGRLEPAVVTSTVRFGDRLYSTGQLELGELRLDGAAAATVPPAGAGAAALRGIWDAGFRLTSEPITVEARIEVLTPGTDLLWQGHQKLRGEVVMEGIGRHLRRATFDFEGDLDAGQELALAAAVRDRWLMWYSRDLGARPAFDVFFAGATIGAPDASGAFAVEGCAVDRVLTSAGVIDGFRRPGGTSVRFEYADVGDHRVVSRIEERFADWTATTDVRWQRVGDEVLPVTLRFERIFGRDWGPETITLRNPKLRR